MLFSHLRSFYTKLLCSINETDLKSDSGVYYNITDEIAMAYSILELAQEKVYYLPEVLYYENKDEN